MYPPPRSGSRIFPALQKPPCFPSQVNTHLNDNHYSDLCHHRTVFAVLEFL